MLPPSSRLYLFLCNSIHNYRCFVQSAGKYGGVNWVSQGGDKPGPYPYEREESPIVVWWGPGLSPPWPLTSQTEIRPYACHNHKWCEEIQVWLLNDGDMFAQWLPVGRSRSRPENRYRWYAQHG